MLNAKEIAKPALALFLICVVVAGALAVVNFFTVEPIAQNALKDADAARQVIFSNAEFKQINETCYAAYEQNNLLGYCIETEAQGYGGTVKIMAGLNAEGNVLKVQVLAADNETPGLGQKVKEESFLQQFTGGGMFVLNGNPEISVTHSIDGIASATYSSRAVVDAVNQAREIYEEMKGGAQ